MEDPHKVRREIPDRGTGAAGNLLDGGHGVPLRQLLELRHDFLVEVDLGAEARVEQLRQVGDHAEVDQLADVVSLGLRELLADDPAQRGAAYGTDTSG